MESLTTTAVFTTDVGWIEAVAFHPKHGIVAAAGRGDFRKASFRACGILTIRRNPIVVWQGHSAPIKAIAFSPDGGWLYSASTDNTIRKWNVNKPKEQSMIVG